MSACEIINTHIINNGIKRAFIAEKTGIPAELLRRSLEGRRKLQADEFISICQVLSLDIDFFKKKLSDAKKQTQPALTNSN